MLYEKPSLEGVLVMDRKKLGQGRLIPAVSAAPNNLLWIHEDQVVG